MNDSLAAMLQDLEKLISERRNSGNALVQIYCANCDCGDRYNGATMSRGYVQITINGEGK